MREEDWAKLKIDYDPKLVGNRAEGRLESVLGIECKQLAKLDAEIEADLDTESLGIGWWKHDKALDAKRRILIADQLHQSISAVFENLVSAKLHYLELQGLWDQENSKFRHAVSFRNGKSVFDVPGIKCPADEVEQIFEKMHLRGFASSLCSALDCLAAIVVGVVGIKEDIFKIGYGGLEKHFREKFKYASQRQREFLERYSAIRDYSGPAGWIDWLGDFRNMFVHRGRRVIFTNLKTTASKIRSPSNNLIPVTTPIRHMVSNPGVSEIEALSDGNIFPLNEEAAVTFEEAFNCTVLLIEGISEEALRLWCERRMNPALIRQPVDQWQKVRAPSYRRFSGFKPDTPPIESDTSVTSERMLKRLKVASLDGDRIRFWKKAD